MRCKDRTYTASSIDLLIAAGADINVLDNYGDHALAHAFGERPLGSIVQ
jgi:hypothetical protein